MKFGLFGSAQAKRGGPNDDSGAGFRGFVERNVAAEAGTLYGSPAEVSEKLQALWDVGVEYVLLNSPSGLPTLRRAALPKR